MSVHHRGGSGARQCGTSALTRSTRACGNASHSYTSEQFQRLVADDGVVCSMSRSGNVWDNAAMENFFSSLKSERTGRKTYRTRDEARADVFERFYNLKRRHSTIGFVSPIEFERQAGLAYSYQRVTSWVASSSDGLTCIPGDPEASLALRRAGRACSHPLDPSG
jgi:putative transposase